MFRSAFEQGAQLGAGPIARLWRGLLVFFSRWWQLETLYRSNMKYQPEWVPRYACYEDARLFRGSGWRRSSPRASWSCRSDAETSSTPATIRRFRRRWSKPAHCTATVRRRTSSIRRRSSPTPRRRVCLSRSGCGWPSWNPSATAASTPIRWDNHPAIPSPARSRSRTEPPSPSPGASCAFATTAVCSSPSYATGPARSSCSSTTGRLRQVLTQRLSPPRSTSAI